MVNPSTSVTGARVSASIHEHQIDDRSQTADGGAQPEADDGLLADRRVDDAVFTELLLQAVEGVEHAPEGADVFTGDEHVGIGGHLLEHRLAKGVAVGQLAIGHDATAA